MDVVNAPRWCSIRFSPCAHGLGRRPIDDAAPQHVSNIHRHFIDLFTPAELDKFADLNDRVLRHLAEEPFPE
jgi:hypothetical protein